MAHDPERAAAILDGFRINWMNMGNADTGKVMWVEENWPTDSDQELQAHLPKELLKCNAVSREINFSSAELLNNFHLVQRVVLHGQVIEEWGFEFGFVIPGSTNTWQNCIESAGEANMIPAEVLSGNLVIETCFYDGDMLVNETHVRIFYV
eukprot:GFYU01001311.1.p1 GENE.GFYU01001311.1~~GFYU01001311.1.p1  ORF type:complete len:151 (-),score=36.12 GFYU01001311.1:202-654(-)